MVNATSRSAVLRRPQSGTPPEESLGDTFRTELVGDEALLTMGQTSGGHRLLCGTLLRAQIATYSRLGHIISFSDEYVMRKIKTAGYTGRLPNIWCRCLRCGCLAHLLDWCVAVDLAGDRLKVDRRWANRKTAPIDRRFMAECQGSDVARDSLLLLD